MAVRLDRAEIWRRFAAEGATPEALALLNVESFHALLAEFVTDTDAAREVWAGYLATAGGDLGWCCVIDGGSSPVESGRFEDPFAAFQDALRAWFTTEDPPKAC